MTRTPLAFPLLAFALLAFGTACSSTDEAGLERYLERYQLTVTESDAPEGAVPIEVLSFYKTGFYLFGHTPIVDISLQEAVDSIATRAHELEADGVAHLTFEVHPAAFFRFSVFPIPDWSAWIQCQGLAYRLPAQAVGAGRQGPP